MTITPAREVLGVVSTGSLIKARCERIKLRKPTWSLNNQTQSKLEVPSPMTTGRK
jgi:hypothetical protein